MDDVVRSGALKLPGACERAGNQGSRAINW
jgi:hypothetical protein